MSMKWFAALAGFVLASASLAVFDLQQVSRFSSSAIVKSGFTHLALKAGGGFVAVGQANQDVLIVDFDAFGSVLRSTIWDSPLVNLDSPQAMTVLADGRITLGVQSGTVLFLVQFSPTLTVNYEVSLPGAGSAEVAFDGTGNAYVAQSSKVESFGPDGAVKGTAFPTNFNISAAKGFPGTTIQGAVLVGKASDNSQPRAIRIDQNTATVFDRTSTAFTAATGSRFTNVDTEEDGDAVMGGQVGSTGNTFALFGSLSNAGLLAAFSLAGGSELRNVKVRNANEAYGFLTGKTLVRLTRTTGLVNASTSVLSHDVVDYVELSGPSVIEAFTNEPELQRFGTSSLASVQGSLSDNIVRALAVGANLTIGVGNRDGNSAAISVSSGSSDSGKAALQFLGAPTRELTGSVVLPDGSVGIICKENDPNGTKLVALRYRPDGSLVFARGFSFGTESSIISSTPLAASPDGSFSFAERLNNSVSWGFARISPTGVVVARTFPIFGNNLQPAFTVPLPSGSTAVIAQGSGTRLMYMELSASGVILQSHEYSDVSGYNAGNVARPVTLASGNLVVAAKLSNGTVTFRAINPSTGAAGAPQVLGTNCDTPKIALDGAGNVVLAFRDSGQLKLERRSGSNLATTLTSATHAGVNVLTDMEVAPNGNVVVLALMPGDDTLTVYGANFGLLTTSTLVSTVTTPIDLTIGATNVMYVMGEENVSGVINIYSARYLATGIRSAQRRTAGKRGNGIFVAGSGVWVTGQVGTRKKGVGPFAARYSL